MTSSSTTVAHPFADSVLAYAQAGWPCILPVPPEKSPPPVGFTGAEGRDTDPMQLAIWSGTHGDWSVALRMPDGVIGIDVDAYVKAGVQKHGAESLAAAVAAWGELPATWSSTARDDEQTRGASRIRFYRVPPGRYATKLAGGDVEIIQRHHRYAVVWPSPHKEGAGDGLYHWQDPAGAVVDAPPKPVELPDLPPAWVQGLREGATEQGPAAADRASGEALLEVIGADTRPACAELTSAVLIAVGELARADAGSRHDTATARAHQLVQLAAAGHPGLGLALPDLAEQWATLTAGEDREGEWERMLLTSARKAVSVVGAHPVANDPCRVMGDIPIATPGGPAPVDDRPGHDAPDPIEAPRELHPQEVVGAGPFDPRAHLDQRLADAVLERMFPVLRYGYDVRGWLLRERTVWDQRDDLAEWAIAQVAEMMPKGEPDADKGSEAKDQADRRKRLMSAAGAGAVAKKMRARVAGGAHPCALRVGDLDSEPWLLWAGGVGWDLTLSGDAPAPAHIDPATPHLRSAGVVPAVLPTPRWDAFTTAVWPDEALRRWALRVLAIACTGYADRALPILLGDRGRGKTQVVALLMSVLGNYAHAGDPRLLNGLDNAHASIIYALKGRRLSFIDEGPREGRLGQERLKQLTGGGDLTGNQMNRNPITFTPTHTLVLTANDDPVLTDPAIRDRVRLIPCEGDPDEVRRTRRAIGHTSSGAWRREAPGVLAAMMREAAAWLAEPNSGLTAAAPAAYQQRVEQLVIEQQPVRTWTAEETEPNPEGERSRTLYEAFVGWSKNGNTHPGRIPSETKFGRELSHLGYPAEKRHGVTYRPLKIRLHGSWLGGGLSADGGGLGEGSPSTLPRPERQENTGESNPETILGEGWRVGLLLGPSRAGAHTRAYAHAHEAEVQTTLPTLPNYPQPSEHGTSDAANPPPTVPQPSPVPFSAQITAKILAGAPAPVTGARPPGAVDLTPKKATRAKVDPAERAAAKAAAKVAALQAKITDAAGELVDLPAVVTRNGVVTPISLEEAGTVFRTFDMDRELTVDVETTGYPIGHADYALRTVQLGNEHAAIVFDADDPQQLGAAGHALRTGLVLHAHSATADLVPLAIADALDLEPAWDRMHDTVIPAKLADPRSTGSDPGLKQLAGTVLGEAATAPAADEARAALFKAGRWLTDTKATTAIERSGWAQVDRRCTTMVRYAASDVLDTAALARRLPPVSPAVLERERTAQRMTARVAHAGVRLDGEHVDAKQPEHQAALAEAGTRLQAFGIDNPGSDQQIGARLLELGAPLPRTKTGRPSVAKGALEQFKRADGPIGDLVRARLDYQHHETVLSLFLDPYAQLMHRGDGRARPTVYTLGADTGRMSCVRPNLQQVPRQGGMRACVTADPGEAIISADFASVEVRVACALSGDPTLRHMLDNDIDLHWEIARQVYGPEATKEDRYNTKRGVFGRLYGSGIPGIARTLGISESLAASTVDTLDAMTPQLARWNAGLKDAVKRGMTTFESYSGRVIHLDTGLPHKALNYCVQGTARELLVDALIRWRDTRWGEARLVPVHDEVLVFVPEADAAEATATLTAAMQTTLHGIDIKAEASAPSFAWQDAS